MTKESTPADISEGTDGHVTAEVVDPKEPRRPSRMATFGQGSPDAAGVPATAASPRSDGSPAGPGGGGGEGDEEESEMISQPAKVMRIGSMVKQLLDEVRAAPLDEASRSRLREIYEWSVRELADSLSPDLASELDRLALPFDEAAPTEAELRIAQAQLVGWLEGLFHGIQATLLAQQMAARAQLDQMRQRGLPSGQPDASDLSTARPGTYL